MATRSGNFSNVCVWLNCFNNNTIVPWSPLSCCAALSQVHSETSQALMNDSRDCLSSELSNLTNKTWQRRWLCFSSKSIWFGNKGSVFPVAPRLLWFHSLNVLPFLSERHCLISGGHGAPGELPIFTLRKDLLAAEHDGEGRSGWNQNGNSRSQPRSPERATPALACQSWYCLGVAEISLTCTVKSHSDRL